MLGLLRLPFLELGRRLRQYTGDLVTGSPYFRLGGSGPLMSAASMAPAPTPALAPAQGQHLPSASSCHVGRIRCTSWDMT